VDWRSIDGAGWLLDCVDKFCGSTALTPNKPFGGVQMIFIGDLYQLPPVVTNQEREIFRSHYASPFLSAKVSPNWNWNLSSWNSISSERMRIVAGFLNTIRNRSVTDDRSGAFQPPLWSFFYLCCRRFLSFAYQHQRPGRWYQWAAVAELPAKSGKPQVK